MKNDNNDKKTIEMSSFNNPEQSFVEEEQPCQEDSKEKNVKRILLMKIK